MVNWNVIQFQILNKGEVVEYDIYTPQLPKWDYCQLEDVQYYTTTSPWSHPSVQNSKEMYSYSFLLQSQPFVAFVNLSLHFMYHILSYQIIFVNLLEMPSCNIDKQVGELLIIVSNELVGMRCHQSFMAGCAHAVR
ncbi:MAG: hypothetical protein EZS28_034912 [Streblomastix strix]|uniref:Uncharacterized protein n=1 Tax=Streblomastix strix TaxID=222440 RepID=A0A5J4UI01_9EUKA|nr:MAG: hypothetical protein EZS28_034912 [Streblomastix strix]